VEEHGQLVRLMQAGSVSNLTTSAPGKVTFEAGRVDIEFEDYTYRLGPFQVEMDLTNASLRIQGLRGAPKIDGHPHPHVAPSGTPCLGNMAPVIAKTLGKGDVVAAVSVVLEFLRSYSEGNGYVRIEKWNPDYEDEDNRYQSCWESVAPHDCVGCDDWDCPYRDGADRRCYENTETNECIECGDCSFSERAIENCRDEHDVWECVECTRSCTWARDERKCHESHHGDVCVGCPRTQCAFNPVSQPVAAQTAAAAGATA
jgi:hypothetical protein